MACIGLEALLPSSQKRLSLTILYVFLIKCIKYHLAWHVAFLSIWVHGIHNLCFISIEPCLPSNMLLEIRNQMKSLRQRERERESMCILLFGSLSRNPFSDDNFNRFLWQVFLLTYLSWRFLLLMKFTFNFICKYLHQLVGLKMCGPISLVALLSANFIA